MWIKRKKQEENEGLPVFRKRFTAAENVVRCELRITATGIFDVKINGYEIPDRFMPGWTNYRKRIDVCTYDVTDHIGKDNVIAVTVANGWYSGKLGYGNNVNVFGDKKRLFAELTVFYADGTTETIVTDESWEVDCSDVVFADFFDGETIDARRRGVICEKENAVKSDFSVPLTEYSCEPVRVVGTLAPKIIFENETTIRYDFGRNFAGVIALKANGERGDKIVAKFGEMLDENGGVYTANLRRAKCTDEFVLSGGEDYFEPKFTFHGFRYAEITKNRTTEVNEIVGEIISQNIEYYGSFECSDKVINGVYTMALNGQKSNFVSIPTDCPQRDERLGWTGDISIFARTACYNYDMSVFLKKWLKDVSAEQTKFGSISMVVPRNGDKFPPFTTAVWGECCILVPWAEYLARGDVKILQDNYSMMKRFAASTKRWAGLFALGKRRYIWKCLFQFGDWCSPVGSVIDWLKTGKWIATAYWANSCDILAKTATLLGYKQDAEKYAKWRSKIISAYREVFTNGKGKLKKEFQTAYVLPLYFNMVRGEEAKSYAQNLARLVKENGNHLTTGFPSTPYILFALADNGQKDVAFDLLLQDMYPSWLYAVKSGATTIWERYDLVDEEGNPNPDGSMNHYAFGAVCDFFYRRILGIEAIEGGYRAFQIKPVMGGDISWAKGKVKTPYGEITVDWQMNDGAFEINLTVPQDTVCTLTLPSGKTQSLVSGSYTFKEQL